MLTLTAVVTFVLYPTMFEVLITNTLKQLNIIQGVHHQKSEGLFLFSNIHEGHYSIAINIFKDNFNHELEDIFDMDYFEPIASGSIGQVYKCRMKNNNKIVAMKVLHPDLDYQIYYPKFLINIIYTKNIPNQYTYCSRNCSSINTI